MGARAPRWFVAGMAMAGAVLAMFSWRFRAPGIWVWRNDDAQYLLLARGLRSLKYLDAHLVGAPPHIQYPPVYPALLAVLETVFGENLDVFLGLNALLAVLALILIADAVRRVWSPGLALLVAAMGAMLPAWMYPQGPGSNIMAEALFTALTAGVLWVTVARPRTGGWMVTAGALALLAALTRSIGVTMIGALGLLWLVERRWRAVLVLAAAASLTEGAWLVWSLLGDSGVLGRSYIADAVMGGRGDVAPGFLRMLAGRIGRNAIRYGSRDFTTAFGLPTVEGTPWDNAIGVGAIVLLAGAGLGAAWRRWKALLLYLACYGGLLLVWPYSVARFLIPVLWLVLVLILAGALEVGRWLRVGRAAPIVVALALLASAVTRDLATAREFSRLCDRSGGLRTCSRQGDRDFLAALDLLRSSAPADDPIVAAKDATVAYLTGRPIVFSASFHEATPDQFRRRMRAAGVRDVLLLRGFTPRDAAIAGTALRACADLDVLGVFGEFAMVLRMSRTEGGGGACADLRAFVDRFESAP